MAFTQEQLAAATQLPLIVIQGVITVDGTTYVSVVREFMAIAGFVDEAQVNYADNLLVQAALLQFVDESGNVNTGLQNENLEHIPAEEVLASVDEAMHWLAGLPELPGYKHFILTMAQRIAGAAGNTLLGTGAKISAEEAALLNEIQRRLGM